jgi:haloacetate dehalogenase
VFDSFVLERLRVGRVDLRLRRGGTGSPIVLVHGHPRTHTTWYRVAPLLAAQHTVICPDLRGYGESGAPADEPDHAQASKRAMADDIALLMTKLGYDKFAIVGHDRGAYVAIRAALDHADRITGLVVLDAVPIGAALARADAHFAQRWWHWFFYGQLDRPERAISADPLAWYGGNAAAMGAENYADYRRAIARATTVHAMLEDYRAGLAVDRAADDEDARMGHRITCPTIVLWASRDGLADVYSDPMDIWREWAPDAIGRMLETGHHMAEEVPDALAQAILNFLP